MRPPKGAAFSIFTLSGFQHLNAKNPAVPAFLSVNLRFMYMFNKHFPFDGDSTSTGVHSTAEGSLIYIFSQLDCQRQAVGEGS